MTNNRVTIRNHQVLPADKADYPKSTLPAWALYLLLGAAMVVFGMVQASNGGWPINR